MEQIKRLAGWDIGEGIFTFLTAGSCASGGEGSRVGIASAGMALFLYVLKDIASMRWARQGLPLGI